MRSVWSLLAVVALVVTLAPARAADDEFFNGKNLDGWEGLSEYWSVKDGAIVGAHEGINFNTFLCSKKKYKDFDLSFKVQLKEAKGNSGVQIRSKIDEPKKFVVAGPQCDIGANYWGSVYGERFGGKMLLTAPAEKVKKTVKATEFNDYRIVCKGKRVTVTINGETMVDDEISNIPEEGIIALQVHAGGPMQATFKDIVFKDLSK